MTATIACEAYNHERAPGHTDMYWYKGEERAHPILTFSKDSESLSTQDGRLYVSGNISKFYNVLVINNLTMSDSAVYVCEVSISLPPPHVGEYGEGTKLTVRESNTCETSKASKQTWESIVFPAILIYSLVVTITIAVLGALLFVRRNRPADKLNPEEASGGREGSHLNSFRGRAIPLSTDRAGEAHNQEYEDMALIRTISQKPR
ncbi:hypothetical protein scyTo_0001650 [Scyliorhinus torazame]|uniref:Ig-like domain-containing protein n=1 Tax=Scyliorhinus torazame TaxID=75743 RepID=A0A401PEU4_SCYTO|nr:hypothetical protein [Scyliorhinus torazame]